MTTTAPSGVSDPRNLRLLLLAVACLLYVAIGYLSPGYDDEFYNIAKASPGKLAAGLDYVMHGDMHPPGQFVIDWALYSLFGSWSLARAFAGLGTALVVTRFARLEQIEGKGRLLLHFVLVVVHPALLMWCTGLRWTSWYVPLFLLAILWIRRDEASPWRFWPVLAAMLLGLFYLNYLALVMVPLIVLLAVHRRWDRRASDWPVFLASGAAAAPFATVLLYFLLRYQLPFSAHYFSGPFKALAGVAQGLAINAGIFALSAAGIATLVVFVALSVWLLWKHREAMLRDPELWFIAATVLATLATGLAGNWRNLVPLVPLLFAKIVPLIGKPPARVGYTLAGLLAVANLYGTFNVARHWETNKGSWNQPVAATFAAIRAEAAACGGTPVLAVHDSMLAGNAELQGFIVMGPNQRPAPEVFNRDGDWCLIRVNGYRGSTGPRIMAAMEKRFPPNPRLVARIGRDPYAGIRQRFDPAIPDYYVEIYSYGRMRRVPDVTAFGAAASGPD